MGMTSPAKLLLLMLPLYALIPWVPFLGPVNTNDILPLISAVAATLLIVQRRQHIRSAVFPWGALCLLGLLMTCAHVMAGHEGSWMAVAARTLGRCGLYAVIGFGIVQCFDADDRERFGKLIVAVIVFEAALGAVATLFGISGVYGMGVVDYPPGHFPAHGWARAQGTFGGAVPAGELFVNRANFYSAYLMIGLFVLVERYSGRAIKGSITISLVLSAIICSGSRMSLLAALVGLAVYACYSGRMKLVAGCGALIMAALAVSAPVRQRFLDLNTDRLELWGQAWTVTSKAPWFGVGDGNYLAALRDLTVDPQAVIHTPHHSILYAGATYGFFVALALVLFYGLLLWKAFELRKTAPALLGMTVGFLVHDMSNNLFFIPEVALSFWMAWAYLSAKAKAIHA